MSNNINYFSDFRVLARTKGQWFISADTTGKFSHVAVKVQTDDWTWLNDNHYDPDEFDGSDIKPMIYTEFKPTDNDCHHCKGSGAVLKHNRWPGIVLPAAKLESYYDKHDVKMYNDKPEDFTQTDCIRCYGTGKEHQHCNVEPHVDPLAEDRVYRPYRIVAWPCVMTDCQTCEGRGRHVNPSIDCDGISARDFDDDPEFQDAYFSGAYDVTCYECNGKKKVPAIDESRMSPEENAEFSKWTKWQNELAADEYDSHAERMAEMRFGC